MRFLTLLAVLPLLGCADLFKTTGGLQRMKAVDDSEAACIGGDGTFYWKQTDPEGNTTELYVRDGCYVWSRPVSDPMAQILDKALEKVPNPTPVP